MITEFEQLLQRAGINKTMLASRLGIAYRTVVGWRNNPPSYAEAYLKLLIEYNRYAP